LRLAIKNKNQRAGEEKSLALFITPPSGFLVFTFKVIKQKSKNPQPFTLLGQGLQTSLSEMKPEG
jgi:hypothetical protein